LIAPSTGGVGTAVDMAARLSRGTAEQREREVEGLWVF
jgi:hypothetical protein